MLADVTKTQSSASEAAEEQRLACISTDNLQDVKMRTGVKEHIFFISFGLEGSGTCIYFIWRTLASLNPDSGW